MRWLKKWGVLIIAVLALIASGYAIYQNNVHYQEITKPHTQHDEIYDRLVRLDAKIERAEQDIGARQDAEQDITDFQEALRAAIELRDQAELAWDKGSYIEADRLIEEAHDVLEKIPTVFYFRWHWWLVAVITIAALSMIFVLSGKTKGERKNK